MKLATKFNLIFTCGFTVGLVAAGSITYRQLHEQAREQVVANARLMMETAIAVRKYTVEQIQPMSAESWSTVDKFFTKLEKGLDELSAQVTDQQGNDFQKIARGIVEAGRAKLKEAGEGVFHPQTVPAFAATESFNHVRVNYPQFEYKEAALNPTNPRDLAVGWESELIKRFSNDPSLPEIIDQRQAEGEPMLFLARPLRASSDACLVCHSTPDVAPVAMVKKYGPDRGFGWKKDSVIAAQVVTVPMSLPISMAQRAFATFMLSLTGVFVITLVILNVLLRMVVVMPVKRLSQAADAVSMGDLTAPEVMVEGNDEISNLSASFARMRRSLEKALKMLDE